MKKFIILILLVLLLTACTVPPTSTPTATATVADTPTVTPTATPRPTPTEPPVDALLDAYLAGEDIDVNSLSRSEYSEFSFKLAKAMNDARGINLVLYKDEGYLNPNNSQMAEYDGHPDLEETVVMYLPITGKDKDGNLFITDEQGRFHVVANSANVDWNMIVTEPDDPRVDLANTGEIIEKYNSTIPVAELSGDGYNILTPMVLLDNGYGVMFFEKDGGGGVQIAFYNFYKIITDQSGNPILARRILVFPTPHFWGYTESSPKPYSFGSPRPGELGNSNFQKDLCANCVNYLLFTKDQDWIGGNFFANFNNYTGFIGGSEVPSILSGEVVNDKDLLFLGSGYVIKRR